MVEAQRLSGATDGLTSAEIDLLFKVGWVPESAGAPLTLVSPCTCSPTLSTWC